jgi:hypothetical protein
MTQSLCHAATVSAQRLALALLSAVDDMKIQLTLMRAATATATAATTHTGGEEGVLQCHQ